MLEVPSVNRLGFAFGSAGEKKGVVDSAPGEATRRDVLYGGEVFLRRERNQSQATADFFDEQQGLLGRDHRLDGQDSHDGVDFCERVYAARRILLVSGGQAFHAGQMVNMTTPEGCNQNGCIEKLLHLRAYSITWRRRFCRSRSRRSGRERSVASPWYTQTPSSFLSMTFWRTGRRVMHSPSVSRWRRGLGRTTRPALSRVSLAVTMAL